MSMYGRYIQERRNEGIVENELGFATYRFIDVNGQKEVYIVDIFVNPDFRKTGVATKMADEIAEIAKRQGCKAVVGTVVPSTNNSTDSLKALLGYGMKLHMASQDLVVFKKEL